MPYFLTFLGDALILAGRREEAAEVGLELIEKGKTAPTWFTGYVQGNLGDIDAAFATFQRAVNEGARPTPLSFATKVADRFRSDPRFAALLRSIGYTGTVLLTRGAQTVR